MVRCMRNGRHYSAAWVNSGCALMLYILRSVGIWLIYEVHAYIHLCCINCTHNRFSKTDVYVYVDDWLSWAVDRMLGNEAIHGTPGFATGECIVTIICQNVLWWKQHVNCNTAPSSNPEKRGCQSRAHAPKPGDHGSTNYPNMTGPTAWNNPHLNTNTKLGPKTALGCESWWRFVVRFGA